MALSEKRIQACARSIVRTSNLRKGDGVVVRGGAHAQLLLEEIALECYRKGATPSIVVTSDRLNRKVYREIPAKTLATTPKQYVGMVKASDMLISVEELEDPEIAAGFPRDKLEARQKAMLPLYDVVYHPRKGKKWLYVGWPTRAAARSFGISYEELERIVIGGLSVPPERLMGLGRRLNRKLAGASWAHVWDAKGTDLKVKIDGRRRNIDDAYISKEDYEVGDRGANLPAGELFVAPHETAGGGTLYCPVTRDRLSEELVTDVRLEFRDGRLLLDETSAGKNEEALKASFRQCETVDRTRYRPVRTTHIAELGIGFNPEIKKAVGYILTDEKVTGTVHLAFGSNNSYGGTSESTMHWDFVSAPGVNIDVERPDGKVVSVMRKGRLL